mmetsp:Transcript_25466/g.78391  ORF Transcript_25466/g.78391 Transcript_25466/m.78391 type:complete len:272 (-) Transcript_25466:194-1009(-)
MRRLLVASVAVALARIPKPVGWDEGSLHFLRVAKSGSSTSISLLKKAKELHAAECEKLVVHTDHHDVRDLGPPHAQTFVVLREPCERFISQFAHLQVMLPKYMSAWKTPLDFMNALRTNATVHARFFYEAKKNTNAIESRHDRVQWAQVTYLYASPDKTQYFQRSHVACLPTLEADLDRIVRGFFPDCVIPPLDEPLNGRSYDFIKTDDLCRGVYDLYQEDVVAYHTFCDETASFNGTTNATAAPTTFNGTTNYLDKDDTLRAVAVPSSTT